MSLSRHIRLFARENKRYILFFIWFAILFAVGQFAYLTTYESTRKVLVDFLHVKPGVALINQLMPEENVRANGNMISGRTALILKRGCDGTDSFLLVLAAVLAFPVNIKRKIIGVVTGFIVMYGCNLIRILALYKIVRSYPAWFEFAHIYFGQMFIILAGTLFFIVWINPLKTAKTT